MKNRTKQARRSGGAALLLVLIAMAMCTIMALSFLAAQGPTAVVASNIDRKTQARQIAESALKMAIDYVNEDADWRTDKTSGTWMTDASLDGGTFMLYGTDEDDGDLSDDATEPVRLSVVATYDGVTHRVSAVVTPGSSDSPGNRLLFVTGNPATAPSSFSEAPKIALLESWGYTVTLMDDSDSQADFDAAVALHDVAYVSEEVWTSTMSTKLRDVTIGVFIEEPTIVDEFGLASSSSGGQLSAQTGYDITDNSHAITAGFSTGTQTLHSSPMYVRYLTSTLASGVTALGSATGVSGDLLLVADTGDTLNFGAAPGRRVYYPAYTDFDVSNLNADGETILQRCIEWLAGGGSSSSGGNMLFVASNDSSPTAEELGKIALFESWGYTVTLIDNGDSQGDYDAAVLLNDVAYIPDEAGTSSISTKLRDSAIGVVFENMWLSDEMGLRTGGTPVGSSSYDSINITDNSHPITDGFSTGDIVIHSTAMGILSSHAVHLASGVTSLGGIPSSTTYHLLLVADTGDTLTFGAAPDRRVMYPVYDLDVANLNADGQTLLKRSVDWAANVTSSSSGGGPTLLALYEFEEQAVVDPTLVAHWKLDETGSGGGGGGGGGSTICYVVADASSLTAEESNEKTQFESWGFTVNLLSDESSAGDYTTAAGLADCFVVSSNASTAWISSKLTYQTIGIVYDLGGFSTYLSVCSSANTPSGTAIDIVDTSHEITDEFSAGSLTIASSSMSLHMAYPGWIASGADILAEELSSTNGGLLAIETGEALNAGTADGRRVKLPWYGSSTNLNTDGWLIYRRSIEWAAGTGGSSGSNLLMAVSSTSSPHADDLSLKTLFESWGYTVTLIDDGSSQATYDAAAAVNDVAYVSARVSSTQFTTKLRNVSIGVVNGDPQLPFRFGFTSTDSWSNNSSTTSIDIIDNSHSITAGFSTGALAVFTSVRDTMYNTATLASGVTVLADQDGAGTGATLAVADTGATLVYGPAEGRRVMSGSEYLNASFLTSDGQTILQRSLEWAAGGGGSAVTTAADETTTANDGTVTGDVLGGLTGADGTAFDFDGSGDYVEIADDGSYLLDAGSVGLHFNPDITTGTQGLFSKDSSGTDNGGQITIYTSSTSIAATIETTSDDPYGTGSTVTLQSNTGVLATGTWYHVLVTFGDGQFRLYLDGTLVDSADHLGGLGTTSGGSGNTEPIAIGASTASSGNGTVSSVSNEFDGRIDDVRIYDLPLDATQAANLAAGSAVGSRAAPGYVALDTSSNGTAADLIVYDPTAISWVGGGGLTFTGDTLATSIGGVSKIHDAIETNGAFAVEMIIQRATPGGTSAPSRIVSYADTASTNNFMFGQDGSKYEARVRDDATGTNGTLSPEFVSTTDLASSGDIHVVLSYSGGNVSVYLDGVLDETNAVGGTLDNWDDTYPLVLGGAYLGGSHWQGTIKRLAIYDDTFNATQATNVFNGDDPGTGEGEASGAGSVQWDEQD